MESQFVLVPNAPLHVVKKALLDWCQSYEKLLQGEFTFEIHERQEDIFIVVKGGLDIVHFSFLVNYMAYPVGLPYKSTSVLGYTTSDGTFEVLADLDVMMFIPENDTEYDNVHLVTSKDDCWKLDFRPRLMKSEENRSYVAPSFEDTGLPIDTVVLKGTKHRQSSSFLASLPDHKLEVYIIIGLSLLGALFVNEPGAEGFRIVVMLLLVIIYMKIIARTIDRGHVVVPPVMIALLAPATAHFISYLNPSHVNQFMKGLSAAPFVSLILYLIFTLIYQAKYDAKPNLIRKSEKKTRDKVFEGLWYSLTIPLTIVLWILYKDSMNG